MLRRGARLALGASLGALVSCGGASLPPLGTRAHVVPIAVSPPSSCDPSRGDAEPPREPTGLERRMGSRLVLPNGDPDLEACRALCRRALRPGDEVVSCFPARSDVKIGCEGAACPERDTEKLRRSIYCGAEGRRAGADPVAAQAAIPFEVSQGGAVVVCSIR